MELRVRCTVHNTTVLPAGQQWHFTSDVDGPFSAEWWTLDLADTWCPISDETHDYSVEVKFNA